MYALLIKQSICGCWCRVVFVLGVIFGGRKEAFKALENVPALTLVVQIGSLQVVHLAAAEKCHVAGSRGAFQVAKKGNWFQNHTWCECDTDQGFGFGKRERVARVDVACSQPRV